MLKASDLTLAGIDLYIISSCNRRCTYCFLTTDFLDSKQLMSIRMVQAIVRWATTPGSSITEITLLGGEPAKHPEFAKIVRIIAEAGLRVRVVTNGSRGMRMALTDPAVAAALSRVSLSLDAPVAEAFNRVRGRKAFEDVMATVEVLHTAREGGIPFDINCTVLRSTLELVPEMLGFAERLGAGRLNIHWFSLVGRARQHAVDDVVSAAEWEWVLEQVASYPRKPGSAYIVDCEQAFAYGLPGEDRGMCAVRERTNLQFFPSGAVFSCGMLVEDESLSGYIWRDGQLFTRTGETEVAKTAVACQGCPLRETQTNADGMVLVPLCIYSRRARNR